MSQGKWKGRTSLVRIGRGIDDFCCLVHESHVGPPRLDGCLTPLGSRGLRPGGGDVLTSLVLLPRGMRPSGPGIGRTGGSLFPRGWPLLVPLMVGAGGSSFPRGWPLLVPLLVRGVPFSGLFLFRCFRVGGIVPPLSVVWVISSRFQGLWLFLGSLKVTFPSRGGFFCFVWPGWRSGGNGLGPFQGWWLWFHFPCSRSSVVRREWA